MFAFTMPIALLGALSDDPLMQLDNASVNSALALGSLFRAIGKGVNGVTVDVVGVRPFLSVIMFVPGIAAFALGISRGSASLNFALVVLAFCNSGAWLCACKVIEACFRKDEWSSCFSILSTCSRMGSVVARVGLGALLFYLKWDTIAFLTAPFFLFSWVFTIQVLVKDLGSRSRDTVAIENGQSEIPKATSSEPRATRIKRMILNRELQLHACIVACASCVMALENMCPLLLKDLTKLDNAEISVVGTVFPASVLAGVLASGQLLARMQTLQQKISLEIGLQAAALLSSVVLVGISKVAIDDSNSGNVSLSYFLCFLIPIAFGMGLNVYVKPGLHSVEFGEDCATASSMLDGAGQAAAVLFQLSASFVFKWGGSWVHVLATVSVLILCMITCSLALFREQNKASKRSKGSLSPPYVQPRSRTLLAVGMIVLLGLCAHQIAFVHYDVQGPGGMARLNPEVPVNLNIVEGGSLGRSVMPAQHIVDHVLPEVPRADVTHVGNASLETQQVHETLSER